MAPGSHRQLRSRSDVRACHPLTTRAWVVVVVCGGGAVDARALARPYSDSHLHALTYRSPVRVVKYSWRCSHCRLRISKLEETPGGRKRVSH